MRTLALPVLAVACSFALGAPGPVRADEGGERLVALAEPLVADDAGDRASVHFAGVYVVTAPTHVPRRYMSELPKAFAAVCGWVDGGKAKVGEPTRHRFFAVFPPRAATPDDSQIAFTIEENNPADLTQSGMENSARFLRGWRQYCVDAGHPG